MHGNEYIYIYKSGGVGCLALHNGFVMDFLVWEGISSLGFAFAMLRQLKTALVLAPFQLLFAVFPARGRA